MSELPEKRSRRATRFSGDYQQFDVSSDEDLEEKVSKRTPVNSKAKRTKECPGCGANVALATKECRFCDYQFTSKSLLVNQQTAAQESKAIRERFPFEPERVHLVKMYLFS
jgi:ribosomal protein S27AE